MKEKKSLRQIQGEQTKKKLFKASVKAIQKHGYNNVTVDEICKSCGVSKGTFYVHYKSKEDIIKESFRSKLTEFIKTELEDFNIRNPEASTIEILKYYLLASFKFCKEVGVELTSLAFIFNLKSVLNCENTSNSISTEFNSELYEIVSKGISDHSFASNLSAEDLMNSIESITVGVMISWCFNGGTYDIIESNNKLITDFVNSISKKND